MTKGRTSDGSGSLIYIPGPHPYLYGGWSGVPEDEGGIHGVDKSPQTPTLEVVQGVGLQRDAPKGVHGVDGVPEVQTRFTGTGGDEGRRVEGLSRPVHSGPPPGPTRSLPTTPRPPLPDVGWDGLQT